MMKNTILLVDDDLNFLGSMQRSFHGEDYEIRCAPSASEALWILRTETIDLVVSDQQMPGMTGTELVARICEEFPDTLRFILTGQATLDIAVDAINRGEISRFFIKPCNTIELAVSIRQALQQKRLMTLSRHLLQRVQRQTTIIEELELTNPGISKLNRDSQGAILLEDVPGDYDKFIRIAQEILNRNEDL